MGVHFYRNFFSISFFVLFSGGLMVKISVVFGFLFSFLCIIFWFAFPLRVWYSSLPIYSFVLICCSLNFKCNSHFLHLYSPHICCFWYHAFVWIFSYFVCLHLPVNFPICDFLLSSFGLFFKIISDDYLLTATLLFVLQLFLQLISVHFFFPSFCLDDFV